MREIFCSLWTGWTIKVKVNIQWSLKWHCSNEFKQQKVICYSPRCRKNLSHIQYRCWNKGKCGEIFFCLPLFQVFRPSMTFWPYTHRVLRLMEVITSSFLTYPFCGVCTSNKSLYTTDYCSHRISAMINNKHPSWEIVSWAVRKASHSSSPSPSNMTICKHQNTQHSEMYLPSLLRTSSVSKCSAFSAHSGDERHRCN